MPPANAIDAISGRLREASPLTDLIAQRCYPNKPTQDAPPPYVVFYRTSGGDGMNLGGRRSLRQNDIRVDAHGRNALEAEAVLAAAADRLDGWQDKSNGVQGCFAQGDADETVLEDGQQVSGQTFSLWFIPQ